jgi:integrase/recombinase XerD
VPPNSARHDEGRSPSTILNDLTACSRVLALAVGSGWLENNLAKNLDPRMFVGSASDEIGPPTDEQAEQLVTEVTEWRVDMGTLLRFLREMGMRLGEALLLRAEDLHPDGTHATLKHGAKRNTDGLKTRRIHLGRAASLLGFLPKRGRLFAALHHDSAVTSTRYGQKWRRQRQGREDRSAADEGRVVETLKNFRLHNLRHAFAIATLIYDSTCIYRLSEHLGQSSVKTTELYLCGCAGTLYETRGAVRFSAEG